MPIRIRWLRTAARHLHGKSVRKGVLASWEAGIVDQLALPGYRRARFAGTVSGSYA